MTEQSIEAHGPDVEAAIEVGLAQLGLGRSDVIIEVVEEGRKGLLGLGSREATVRLTPLPGPKTRQPVERTVTTDRDGDPPFAETAPVEVAPEAVTDVTSVEALRQELADEHVEAEPGVVDEEVAATAQEILRILIDKMGYQEARISVSQTEPDDKSGRTMALIQVEGSNLSALIGPHGSTLNDLQYLARLIAGHVLRRRADFIVDVDGYRQQRKEALTSLARRMAGKALERERPITLEPMSAYDRRLIHMALRDHSKVYTSSVGEGQNRRVRIYLKETD